ncbi:TetR/AcrR family transcriptional regulator [Geobacillus sp. BMUD]|uniref:TetR/AcrR family transcriptional regulator n=1 Tax=Geobacillus TaxID=129337 RepID=UPI0004DF6CBB|nr:MULTISPECIES: TetR/AcrR family transcriptional regulator [Geobacillus]NNU83097.1 TetR/AcrR family transcriptional regulator [Geobacillus sp. BMUD]
MGRKEDIIETAMKLFAEKGYHATSMQEIAERSGVAKGSIYNYFKSKEELAVSIFRYHYEVLFHQLKQIEADPALTARERFCRQLTVQIQLFDEHKELVQMQLGEQAAKVSDEVRHLVFRIRAHTLHWYRRAIEDIYGEQVRPVSFDCATMLNGMLKEYLIYLAVDRKPLLPEKLAPFLLDRLDAIVSSLLDGKTGLLDEAMMADYIAAATQERSQWKERAISCLERMAAMRPVEDDILRSLRLLKEELEKGEAARPFMVKALLLYLAKYSLPLFNELKEAIERYFP